MTIDRRQIAVEVRLLPDVRANVTVAIEPA